MSAQTYVFPRNSDMVARLFDQVLEQSKGRFFGFENVTAKGVRKWSIASRPPHAAIDALVGATRAPDPSTLRRVWDGGKHAWRSVDLTTARALWFSVNGVTFRYEFF